MVALLHSNYSAKNQILIMCASRRVYFSSSIEKDIAKLLSNEEAINVYVIKITYRVKSIVDVF